MSRFRIFSRPFRFKKKLLQVILLVLLFLMLMATVNFHFYFKFKETQPPDARLKLYSTLVHENGLPVFFVDPFILLPLLPNSTRVWVSFDPFVKDMYDKFDSLTEIPKTLYAGIAVNDTKKKTFRKFVNEIMEIAIANNFSANLIKDVRPIAADIDVSISSLALPNHILVTTNASDKLTLHILVFHTVENATFFWTAPYKPVNTAQRNLDTPLGKRATIFDEFSLQNETVTWLPTLEGGPLQLLVPSDLRHFIQQIPHAAYVQCNRTHAKEYRLKYANFSNASQVTADALHRFTLEQTKSMFKAVHIPFWACCGTLLGWYRECGAVRYTTDADYCVFGSFASDSIVNELLKLAKSSKKLDMMWTLGLPSVAFEITFRTEEEPVSKEDIQWDINFIYANPAIANFTGRTGKPSHNGNEWVESIHHGDDHSYHFQHMPRTRVKEFCSTALWGLKMQVPCDPLPHILNFYGDEEWKRPIHSGFDYEDSLSQTFYWNEEDYSRAYVIHRNLREH